MSDTSWLRRRAEAAARSAICAGTTTDLVASVECSVEGVAREFAERAVRWGVPRFYDVTSDDTVAEIIAAADKDDA